MKKLHFSSLALVMAAFMGMSSISATPSNILGPDGNTYTLSTTPLTIAAPTNASAQAQANWAANAADRSNPNVTFAPGAIVDSSGLFVPAHVINDNNSYSQYNSMQYPKAASQVRSNPTIYAYI